MEPTEEQAIRRHAQANSGCIGRISFYPYEILDLFAELDKWRSIAADLAEAVEPFDFTMRGGQVEYDNLVAHMERRDDALARYREAAGA